MSYGDTLLLVSTPTYLPSDINMEGKWKKESKRTRGRGETSARDDVHEKRNWDILTK